MICSRLIPFSVVIAGIRQPLIRVGVFCHIFYQVMIGLSILSDNRSLIMSEHVSQVKTRMEKNERMEPLMKQFIDLMSSGAKLSENERALKNT
jgi:hypothetical protein